MSAQKAIEEYLINGGVLTVVKARQLFGTTELRRVVSRARRKGLPIVSDRVDHMEDDKYHHEYFIMAKDRGKVVK